MVKHGKSGAKETSWSSANATFDNRKFLPQSLFLGWNLFCGLVASFLTFGFVQGVFFNWPPPKKLKYLEPRLGESTST